MTTNEIVEIAIQGHASTRDAIRWAIQQEREACAKELQKLRQARDDLLTALSVVVRDYEGVYGLGNLEMQPALYQAFIAIWKATGGEK
jgi:hypothetical protein